MKMLIIVARESMLGELEQLLRENGIIGYTILNHVLGKGAPGKMVGTFFQPDINSIIFAVLPSNQADRAVSALTAFHTARGLATQGQPVPIKVFTLLVKNTCNSPFYLASRPPLHCAQRAKTHDSIGTRSVS